MNSRVDRRYYYHSRSCVTFGSSPPKKPPLIFDISPSVFHLGKCSFSKTYRMQKKRKRIVKRPTPVFSTDIVRNKR